jgi:hypothetical protein
VGTRSNQRKMESKEKLGFNKIVDNRLALLSMGRDIYNYCTYRNGKNLSKAKVISIPNRIRFAQEIPEHPVFPTLYFLL